MFLAYFIAGKPFWTLCCQHSVFPNQYAQIVGLPFENYFSHHLAGKQLLKVFSGTRIQICQILAQKTISNNDKRLDPVLRPLHGFCLAEHEFWSNQRFWNKSLPLTNDVWVKNTLEERK